MEVGYSLLVRKGCIDCGEQILIVNHKSDADNYHTEVTSIFPLDLVPELLDVADLLINLIFGVVNNELNFGDIH